jgi:hypothetical protein
MRVIRGSVVLLLVAVGQVAAQGNTGTARRHPLEGVWNRMATVADGNITANQPGYRMFVDGIYSTVRVEGLAPRVPAPDNGATAAQLRAAYGAFTAQAGRYDAPSVQTVAFHPEVAFGNGIIAAGVYNVQTYRIVGDTLWTANIYTQTGPVASPPMGKYLRARHGGASPLDGAWRLVDGRAPDGKVLHNQPGYRLMLDGHYSIVRGNGTTPRPAAPGPDATADQLLAVWGPFTAQQGTFDVSGQTLTERALVAKGLAVAAPENFATRRFRIAGDTMWLTQTASQNGPVKDAPTFKYVRVRGPRPPTD